MERKPDEGHVWTDEQLAALEKRIAAEYKKAADELQAKIDAYFEKFKARDAEKLKLLQDGKITEQEYLQWRLAQIGRGERFEALRDRMAERYTKANEVTAAYINDTTPGIYSLNRNYAAYTIEQQTGGNVAFDLWDEQTVKRLIVERPDLMPYYPPERAVNRGIDLAWGKKQITAQITSGILQGESMPKIAKRLQTNIPDMERVSAVRAARTAVTGAQNAGRQDSYIRAEEMGIELEKQWIATLDNRTRHDHAEADGQTVEENKPFIVGGYELMYPGDSNGPPHEIYQCRCTMIAKVKGVDMSDAKRRARDPETGKNVVIDNMTYAEWAGWKQSSQGQAKNGILSMEDVQDFSSLKSYMMNKFHVQIDDAVGKLDFLSIKEGMRGIEYIIDEFPQAATSLKKIATSKSGMMCAGYDGSINFNPVIYKTRESVLEGHGIGLDIKPSGLHPKGNNPRGSGAHETGHILEKAIIDKVDGGETILGQLSWNDGTFAKSIVSDACKAAKKETDGKGKTNAQLKGEISRYAMANASECMAEAVCDFTLNGKEAAILSKEIWKILKRELG